MKPAVQAWPWVPQPPTMGKQRAPDPQVRLPRHLLWGKLKSPVILLRNKGLRKAALEMPLKRLQTRGT